MESSSSSSSIAARNQQNQSQNNTKDAVLAPSRDKDPPPTPCYIKQAMEPSHKPLVIVRHDMRNKSTYKRDTVALLRAINILSPAPPVRPLSLCALWRVLSRIVDVSIDYTVPTAGGGTG